MKRLAGRQTRFVNKQERRTGSLWEGRYNLSPIDTENYLLKCCRYVELNPMKAQMVLLSSKYPSSSYAAKVGKTDLVRLDLDCCYQTLGLTNNERHANYALFVNDVLAANKESRFIKSAVERNQLTGNSRFIDETEQRTGVRVEYRSQGRPTLKVNFGQIF